MDDETARSLLESLLARARSAGAEAADAVLYHSVSSEVSWRLGKLEDVERSEGRDLGLRILVGRRQASVSTTDFSPAGLDALAERCAAMAKAAPEDPWCGLAPEDKLARGPFPDFDLFDGHEPSTEELAERAAACEAAALDTPKVVNSSGAGAGYGAGSKWFITSHGFYGAAKGSSHSVSVSVQAQDGEGMERDYEYDSAAHLEDLEDAAGIGRKAGARAVRRLNPRKMKSRTAPVVFEQRLAASLLGPLAGAVNGGAVARGVSFLKDKMGARLFPETICVIDDPHRRRGAGSRPFDGEGVVNARKNVIDQGVLTTWLLNSAQARQLGLPLTGHASRGTGGAPGAGPTNFYMQNGSASLKELIADISDGLYVTDLFGPQVNPNTGDYSVGCAGLWIENGALAFPVSEITIAGNLLEMYAALTPANDVDMRRALSAPTLRIERMTIAGD